WKVPEYCWRSCIERSRIEGEPVYVIEKPCLELIDERRRKGIVNSIGRRIVVELTACSRAGKIWPRENRCVARWLRLVALVKSQVHAQLLRRVEVHPHRRIVQSDRGRREPVQCIHVRIGA